MICFNVICRIDNCIVFSDLVLPLWATVNTFPSFLCAGEFRGAVFCPVTSLALCKRGVSVSSCLQVWRGSLSAREPSDGPALPSVSLIGCPPWTRMTHDNDGLSRPVGSMACPPAGKRLTPFRFWIFCQHLVFSFLFLILFIITFLFGCIRSWVQQAGSLFHHAGPFLVARGLSSWDTWA